jgi:nitrite reductase/ring-hydroxylating ferredoxin subunit
VLFVSFVLGVFRHVEANMPEIAVGALADFPEGKGTPVQVGNRRLAIFRLEQRLFAVEDRCPHRGFPLHDGAISESTVRCRTHGSCFDLASGNVLRGPATQPVRVYPARSENDQVWIELPD